MLKIETTKLFEKDVKKSQKRGRDLKKLKVVIDELAGRRTLSPKYKDHKLTGQFMNFKECHIEPDWLLIYKIENSVLYLARLGTHSDFF